MSAVFGRGNIRSLLSQPQQVEFTRLLQGTAMVREVQLFNTHSQYQLNIVFVMSDVDFCIGFPRYALGLSKEPELAHLLAEGLRLEAWVQLMPSFRTWAQGFKVPGGRQSGLADVMFLPAD